MAIYHLHIDSYRRSRGRTAIGGVAYRRGLKAACPVSGKRFNFRMKDEVAFSELIPAKNDTTDYRKLNNLLRLYESIERTEKHPRATLGREIEAALPHELPLPQQVELVQKFVAEVRKCFNAERAFFDFSIHAKQNNIHAHICMSEREQISCFVFEKTKRRDWDGEAFVSACREIWQTQTNAALERAGINQRVDSRSHADRGFEVLPSLHEGKAAYFKSEVKNMNDIIQKKNQELLKVSAAALAKTSHVEVLVEECCVIEGADEQTKTQHQYRLAARQYEGFNIHGLTFCNMKNPKYVTLFFTDRSKIVDSGQRIVASGGTAEDNAKRLIELARLKKWEVVRLSGPIDFVKAAMISAQAAGLDVSPIDDEQRELWAQIQATKEAANEGQVIENAVPVLLSSLNLAEKLAKRRSQNAPEPQNPRQRGRGLRF